MNTFCFLYQYQNQGTAVKTAFPRDLETYKDMIGNEKNKIHLNMTENQKCYYKRLKQ